ncbi:MAG: sensor histidine kinase [Rubrivivax sp.]|nr:MAG: sensor histidine kinase [Rubrivivax sp.]
MRRSGVRFISPAPIEAPDSQESGAFSMRSPCARKKFPEPVRSDLPQHLPSRHLFLMHELQSPRVELLHDIAADADFEARALNRSVIIDAPDSFVANVNGELIYRALENVIRNAVKHTAEGSAVVVRASTTANGGRLKVAVRDHGPGVPPRHARRDLRAVRPGAQA